MVILLREYAEGTPKRKDLLPHYLRIGPPARYGDESRAKRPPTA